MALLWIALAAPSLAQDAGTGLTAGVPALRAGVADSGAATAPNANDAADTPAAGATATDSSGVGKAKRLRKTNAKTADRTKFIRVGPPPLPALQPYRTPARQRGSVGSAAGPDIDSQPVRTPGPTVAVLPGVKQLRLKTDDTPYEAVGVQAGSLRITPYVAQSFGYDSNPDQVQTGVKPSAFSRTEGGLGVVSEWSRNQLTADLHGGYNDYFSDPGANRPDALGTIDLKIDANRDTILDAEQRFSIDTQRPGSPEVSIKTIDRPLITTFGTTLGGTETYGRLAFGLHGSFDRTAYDNADVGNGQVEDLANGNYNDYGIRGRASYELTNAIKPFVDVLVDRRIHDAAVDLSSYRRDSTGVIGQLGSTFEFNRLFSGSLSGGYGSRSFEDPRLRDLSGPVVNGSLDYAITPITVISLKGSTSFDETTVAGASGSQSRTATLQVAHQLLRNLTVTGGVTYTNNEYIGAPIVENTWSESLVADYHLSRWLVATASYNHADLHSSQVNSSYAQDVFLLGLRLQK